MNYFKTMLRFFIEVSESKEKKIALGPGMVSLRGMRIRSQMGAPIGFAIIKTTDLEYDGIASLKGRLQKNYKIKQKRNGKLVLTFNENWFRTLVIK